MLVLLQMFIYNPVYKTGNGHLRSGNCQKTLDMGVIFLVDIDLYPISNRIVYQIDGFIETAFRRPGSRYVFQYLKRNLGCVYSFDISCSYFFKCSSIILFTKPEMGTSGAVTARKRLIWE